MEKIKTFLAGPDCFYPNFEEMRKEKIRVCEEYGLEVLPFGSDAEKKDDKPVTDHSICWDNIERLENSDLVIANLTHFRGPEPDSGTVYECAYAFAKGKKVYAYYDYVDMVTAVEKEYGPVTWEETVKDDGTVVKSPKDKDGRSIENWGKALNLMLTGSFPCIHGSFEDVMKVIAKDLGLVKRA